jgi:lysophospholipid acyltransferase (LPLAT)-like uncharacterized protein
MRRRDTIPFRLSVGVGGWLVAAVLRVLGATWRIRVAGADPLPGGGPVIGALWHRGLFCAAHRFRDLGAVIPVSRSRDGDRIVAVLRRLGFGPSPRGSSSSGAASVLAGLIRAAQAGHHLGILCDGPRGPMRRAKVGVLAAARATGLAIHPLGIAARPALEFGSWDRALLPLPFARVAILWGAPLAVPREASREELEALRSELERTLDRLQDEAEASLAH